MRPRRFGRKFFGLASIGTSALVALLSAGRPALAQSDDKPAPAKDDKADGEKDEAFAKKVTEVEKGLNDFLLVDEDKKVHVRKEFAEGLRNLALKEKRRLPGRAAHAARIQLFRLREWRAVWVLAVLALAAFVWFSRRDAPADANLKFTPLTAFGGSKQYPAFSPDGSRMRSPGGLPIRRPITFM